MNKIARNRGYMQVVLLAVAIIAGLAYFNVDLRAIVANGPLQNVVDFIKGAWTNYLWPIFSFVWGFLGHFIGGAQN